MAFIIPTPPTIGPFPIRGDYGGGQDIPPAIAVHLFDAPGLKTEQRFYLGDGARRFRIVKARLACGEYEDLKSHWLQAQGTYAQFPYTHHIPGGGTEDYICRYENPTITFEQLVAMISGDPGVTLLEVPQTNPSYTSVDTVTRFPGSVLSAALQSQVQRLIPLIAMQPRAAGELPIYLSSQRCKVDTIQYEPRLLNWSGVRQSLGESSDAAQFTFGNADRAFTEWANATNLQRAYIQLALFHVESNVLCKLWGGYVLRWRLDPDGKWTADASDGVFELTLPYPMRQLSRNCWKVYKGRFCPSVSALDTCPKSWAACVERGVSHSFGGAVVQPTAVHIADNSTGSYGFGRSAMTSVTVSEDTIYQRVVQEIYTDQNMRITCDVAGGRDESDFYSALGIVGEGPIGGYSSDLIQQRLDNQPPHDPLHRGGWRGITGLDPAPDQDFFDLDSAPWNTVPAGASYAAGLAFAEIRRTDEKGLQLSKVSDRAMSVVVSQGIAGWVWTAPGARNWQAGLSNWVWVAVNVYLRALGMRADQRNESVITPAQMEAFFDVTQAITQAGIADQVVDKLVGAGTERQFPFRGAFKEQKPLKDWLQEICNTGLGFYTFVNGRLWLGSRTMVTAGVLAGNAFTRATILYNSFQAMPSEPRFNWLYCEFGDEEFDWQLNNSNVYDEDQAKLAGTTDSPRFTTQRMTLVGCSNKSQAARIAGTRVREEVGGVGPSEQLAARQMRWSTTVLALQTMVGDIVSMDHANLPGLRCKGRVSSWTLNPDYSIDIEASPMTDAMYDLTFGPRPHDVPADPVPPELLPSPAGLAWFPNEEAPFAGDPLYSAEMRTFALFQDYLISRSGGWQAALWVRGELAINQFISNDQPRITGIRTVTGGSLTPGNTYYVVVAYTSNIAGQPLKTSQPSNVAAVWIPPAQTGRKIQIDIAGPGGYSGHAIWAGYDLRTVALQASNAGTPMPATLTVDAPILRQTRSKPDAAARQVRVKVKHVIHSGIAGLSVTSVTAPNRIQCLDFIGSTDNWLNRIVSTLSDLSDGSAPLWNFKIIGFTPATGELEVSPDCVRGDPDGPDSVQAGDVLIVRSRATSATSSATSTVVTDAMWNNSVARQQFGSPGLAPGQDIGNVLRIIAGAGAGQFRTIVANTATSITVSPALEVLPDATSVVIVEAADWMYAAESSVLPVPEGDQRVEIRVPVENLRDQVALVGGFLVDDTGRETDESVAVYREIYVYGQPPLVRYIGPAALDPDGNPWTVAETDHTIRVDTSTNDVPLQLLPLYLYAGRTLLILNDGGPNNAIVTCTGGELYFDGEAAVTVPPNMSLTVTAG